MLTMYEQLEEWFQGSIGARLYSVELQYLAQLLPNYFGYYLVQLGLSRFSESFEYSPIKHCLWLGPQGHAEGLQVYSDFYPLPLAANSMDLILLPHLLELSDTPQRLLKEVMDILIPGGVLIILGFNPFSLWGLWRLYHGRGKQRWQGNSISSSCVRKWLAIYGCEVEKYFTFYFRPPFKNNKLTERLLFMETLGQLSMPNHGGIFCMVARKQEACGTMLTTGWCLPHWHSNVAGQIIPTAREQSL